MIIIYYHIIIYCITKFGGGFNLWGALDWSHRWSGLFGRVPPCLASRKLTRPSRVAPVSSRQPEIYSGKVRSQPFLETINCWFAVIILLLLLSLFFFVNSQEIEGFGERGRGPVCLAGLAG